LALSGRRKFGLRNAGYVGPPALATSSVSA
jgi:hypothetical protein